MKWMDEAQALHRAGVAEIPGPQSNPAIMAMFEAAGADWVKGDDTPWCGATVAWCIKLAGLPLPAEPLRARGWSEYGTKLDKPRTGCVVVLERGSNPEQGHVGFLESFTDDALHVVGGNQGDKVSIAAFPRSKVVAYRWPPVPTASAADKPLAKSWTLRGAAIAALGTVVGWLETAFSYLTDLAGWATDAASALGPVAGLAKTASGLIPASGAALVAAGLVIVISRRVQQK